MLKRCRSPTEFFEFIGKGYDPENEVATQYLFDKFHEFSIPQNSNPIVALHAFEDINNQIEEKGADGSLTLSYTRVLSVRCLPSTTMQKKHYNR